MATMIKTLTNLIITVSPVKRTWAPWNKRPPALTAIVRENQVNRRIRWTQTETPPPLRFQNIEDSNSDYEVENKEPSYILEELPMLIKGLKIIISQ